MSDEKKMTLKLTLDEVNVLFITLRKAVGKGLLEQDDEDKLMDVRDRLFRWLTKQETTR